MSLLRKLINIFFPPRCVNCQQPLMDHQGLCHVCWDNISFITPPWCNKCGAPGDNRVIGYTCNTCPHHSRAYDKLRTATKFHTLSKALIHKFKYQDSTELSPLLSSLAIRACAELTDADLIVPVPMHHTKLRKRNYNQAALLASHIANTLKKSCYMNLLQRPKPTSSQVGLNKRLRNKNLVGAFTVNKKYLASILGKKVLLVDDVISTGATAHECSKTLKRNGASHVYVVCIARNDISLE